eukprot:jgi/Mesvir1/20525/Mv12403-RA.1
MRSPGLHLSQFIETTQSYQNTRTLLMFYDPAVILVSSNADGKGGLITLCKSSQFQSARKVVLERGMFDDSTGMLLIRRYADESSSIDCFEKYEKQYYLCLAATAAICKWVETEHGLFIVGGSLPVSFNGSFNHLQLDAISVESLELVPPTGASRATTSTTLLGLLDKSHTKGGARLLRSNLLQPLVDVKTIHARLDCQEELLSNERLFFGLQPVIKQFPKSLDRIVSVFMFQRSRTDGRADGPSNERTIASILQLKQAIELVPMLAEALADARCEILQGVRTVAQHSHWEAIRTEIDKVIDVSLVAARSSFVSRTQQCFAVRAGVDGFLDMARTVFSESSEAALSLCKDYRVKFSLPSLKMPYSNARGFYISIAVADAKEGVPAYFIQVSIRPQSVPATLPECSGLGLEQGLSCDCAGHGPLSFILRELLLEGCNLCRLVARKGEALSLLDMLVFCFANLVVLSPVGSYSRPDFTENGPLAIHGGRHPVQEKRVENFVPNDCYLEKSSNMMILSAPNMSGKSTYLRQVALICVLAHVGCYVPATVCSLRPLDRIFTRLGTNDEDNIESNSSSFMTEMRETAYILSHVTPRSLVVVDELGRSTSSLDGFAIAWAVCEHLLSLNTYVLFATHMQRMAELATLYPNAKVRTLSTSTEGDRLRFQYKLADTSLDAARVHYGLLLAEAAGFPSSIIERAHGITHRIDQQEEEAHREASQQCAGLHLRYNTVQKIMCLQGCQLSEGVLRDYMQKLKLEYLNSRAPED